MQENVELVQRGFRVLVSSLSGYIGQEFNRCYRNHWWTEVLGALSDQRDLPYHGTYGELIDSLDIANCIRLIDRRWVEVFREHLPFNCRTWAKELMGVRNTAAHLGQQDLDQREAERALDTMSLLCQEIDPDGAEEIRKIYQTIRARADGAVVQAEPVVIYSGLEQPESESRRGALVEGSLLSLVGTDMVQSTTLSRKVTYGGKTVVYPVYRVRLDALYYNDQNDRIATWISRYEAENGVGALSKLDTEAYNHIIENFIVESNPESIQKTQKNIMLVGQREPGVTLADGRIVDGNRRFTCLRRIQRNGDEPVYFETVLMDMDIKEDKKQIKLLELAIQHGEEKKVDYDLIDYAIGTYRDIVQTSLLTIEEYASSTNETVGDVKKRIAIAEVISEFLEYLQIPEQYHAAREYQVYSLFQEMMAPMKKLSEDEQDQLKEIAFNNALMKAIPDQRKFIRDINTLVRSETYVDYFAEQQEIGERIKEKLQSTEIHSKQDIDRIAEENPVITEDLEVSMERAMRLSRQQYLKAKPIDNVNKCIGLMTEVDPRVFGKMDQEEKELLRASLEELTNMAKRLHKLLAK